MAKERDTRIDIVKGLAILTVVLGHSGCPGKPYIYLFHMAVFFMASGYCFSEKHAMSAHNMKEYIWKKLKTLYAPYVVFNAIFLILFNVLIKLNIYTDNPEASFAVAKIRWWDVVNGIINLLHFEPGATQQLCGADWFIIVLFYIVIAFAVLKWLMKPIKNVVVKDIIMLVLAVLFLLFGYALQKRNAVLAGFMSPTFSCYILYVLGYFMKKASGKVNPFIEKFKWVIIPLGVAALYGLRKLGWIALNENYYANPLFLIVCSLVGWCWLMAFACVIDKTRMVKKASCYLGTKTIYILFLHFLSFKVVSAIQVAVYHEPRYMIASFPILHNDGIWWLIYTVAGCVIPLVIEKIYAYAKQRFLKAVVQL